MTYIVQAGSGGYLGWRLLEKTADTQRAAHDKDPQVRISSDYFKEKMPNVTKADELVSDFRLLSVALRAFGLDGDLKNRLFIKRCWRLIQTTATAWSIGSRTNDT